MGVVDQTKLFWETAIEVAKSSGMDEVTGSLVQHLRKFVPQMLATTGICLRLFCQHIGKAQKAQVCTNFKVLGSQNRVHLGCCWNGERQVPSVCCLGVLHQYCNFLQASTIAEVIKLIEHQRQDFVQPGTAQCSNCPSLLNHLLSDPVHSVIYMQGA